VIGIQDWICDLLMSRGALVEPEEDGRIRAMLPADVAASLGATEWLSLDLRPQPGGDDAVEWMDRMERLLPVQPLVVGAQARSPQSPANVNAAAILDSELAIQNGVYRLVEDYAAAATNLFFTFQYTVESDDRSDGIATVCLNADAGSMVATPESFLMGIRDRLDEDPQVAAPAVLARWYPAANLAARAAARKHAIQVEHNANRRLARDAERVESYYEGLLAQVSKRIARKAGDPVAAEKERSRARAIAFDRTAKLEDLRRKYALRIRTGLALLLAVRAPGRQISVRLIRKKEERAHVFSWNPVVRALDQPLCEHCCAMAHPLYLCERVHLLCKDCWTQCADCSRFFCRKCHKHCKCGVGKAGALP
jgi:hypothetical protein